MTFNLTLPREAQPQAARLPNPKDVAEVMAANRPRLLGVLAAIQDVMKDRK